MIATVVEFCRPAVCMTSNPLSHLAVPAIFQVSCDSGRLEAVTFEPDSKLCISVSALNPLIGVGSVDGLVWEFACSTDGAPEKHDVQNWSRRDVDFGVKDLLDEIT